MNSGKALKVDKEKPKNFDDLVKIEKLRIKLKNNERKLGFAKNKKDIKKYSLIIKNTYAKIDTLKKKLGANKS